MSYLKNEYIKSIADKVSISVEDLTETELQIIHACFDIFKDRLSDIKTIDDENKRLNIEIANLKAYKDNKDYEE